MSIKKPNILKNTYRNGYRLTQRDYEDWLDSYLNNKTVKCQSINSDLSVVNAYIGRIKCSAAIASAATFNATNRLIHGDVVYTSAVSRSVDADVLINVATAAAYEFIADITDITSVASTANNQTELPSWSTGGIGRELFVKNSSAIDVGLSTESNSEIIDSNTTGQQFMVSAGTSYSFVKVKLGQWLSRSFN